MAQQHRISRRTVVGATGGALAAGAALAISVPPGMARAEDEAGLVGVWVVTSTRAGSVPNGILVTVHPDGSFLRTGNAHPTESPAMGVWRQAEAGVYDVTYMALQFDTAGMFIGHRKTWLRITPDPAGDTFTGRFRVVTIDTSGTESAPTEGEIRGVRMGAEPFV